MQTAVENNGGNYLDETARQNFIKTVVLHDSAVRSVHASKFHSVQKQYPHTTWEVFNIWLMRVWNKLLSAKQKPFVRKGKRRAAKEETEDHETSPQPRENLRQNIITVPDVATDNNHASEASPIVRASRFTAVNKRRPSFRCKDFETPSPNTT